MIGGKVLRLGWAARCMDCDRPLAPGERAWWFHLEDVGRCMSCAEPAVYAPPADVAAPPTNRSAPPPRPTPSAASTQAAAPRQRPSFEAPEATQPQPERSAGASAQAEYERRRNRDRARIRQNLPRSLLMVLAAPFVGYFAAQISVDILDGLFRSMASSATEGGAGTESMFNSALAHRGGLVTGLALTISALKIAFARRQSTEAWRIGAQGERLTGRVLEKLPRSYRVLHDLPMPRSSANIDHVVVGPTGVFTVETKNYKNAVTIKGGRAYSAGRRLDGVVQQARWQAAAVADRTGVTVTPIVCVHGAGVRLDGWFQKPVVGGVRFCSGGRLRKTIAGYPVDLDDDTVQQVAHRLT